MSNVEKFDPSKLMDGVKDRIKATFVGLIPDDQWEQMVRKEVDAFFEPRNVKYSRNVTYGYGGTTSNTELTVETEESPFRTLVWEHCNTMTKEILKDKLDKEYFTNTYVDGKEQMTEAMQKMAVEMAPAMAARFFESLVPMSLYELRNRVDQLTRTY